MIADVDDDGSNEIDFGEFCKVISKQKSDKAGQSDETDTSARRAAPRRGFTRFFFVCGGDPLLTAANAAAASPAAAPMHARCTHTHTHTHQILMCVCSVQRLRVASISFEI